MIKFTIIWIVVYLVCAWFTKMYVKSLDDVEQLAIYLGHTSTKWDIWTILLGLMKIGCVVLGAISIVMLACQWL